jgi:hypothetical protein
MSTMLGVLIQELKRCLHGKDCPVMVLKISMKRTHLGHLSDPYRIKERQMKQTEPQLGVLNEVQRCLA